MINVNMIRTIQRNYKKTIPEDLDISLKLEKKKKKNPLNYKCKNKRTM